MDVYHKILLKLYQMTGGKQSETVDFVELIKQEGFFPSYDDIHRQMSRAGWITDAGRGDKVKITHWGVKEAKKSGSGKDDSARELQKMARRLQETTKELLVMTEELAGDVSPEKLKLVENKFSEVRKRIDELKSGV